jgi:hypothetical protein
LIFQIVAGRIIAGVIAKRGRYSVIPRSARDPLQKRTATFGGIAGQTRNNGLLKPFAGTR